MPEKASTRSGEGGRARGHRLWHRHAGSAPAAPADVRTRAEFGEQLEHLRERSGRSLRDLAGEISATCSNPIGPSALGEWCRGKRLPLPSRYDAFRRLLELLGVDDIEPWIETAVRLRSARGRRSIDGESPYMGLRSFGRDDADRFFGRDELVGDAFTVFRQVAGDPARPSMVWIIGPSGAGKSSLLHAGLCPVLEAAGWTCLSSTPGPHPATRLTAALSADRRGDVVVSGQPMAGAERWATGMPSPALPAPGGLVLVIDQFEELFRECDDESQRQRFLSLLSSLTDPATAGPDGGTVVVVGLRIDFYGHVAAHDQLVPSLQGAQILVGPLNRAQLRQSIVEPARQVGVSVDDDLVTMLLRDFVPSGSIGGLHDPGSLPLLAHALHETWSGRAARDRMTLEDYDLAGGVGGTIEAAAEQVYEQLTSDEQALAKEIFLRLVHLEGEGALIRRAASYAELEGLEGRPRVAKVIDLFVSARLLTAQRTTVTIVHESLLAEWPRLSSWIDEDREALHVHRHIRDAAHHWADGDRDASLLVSGSRLEAMQSWADRESLSLRLSQLERDFLAGSHAQVAHLQRAKRRQTRRLQVLTGIAATFAVLASALVVVVNRARHDAASARDEALSRQTALNAEQLRLTDPALGAQLAVAGYEIAPTLEARSSVLSFAAIPTPVRHLGREGPTALAVPADGSPAAVSDAADGTVRLLTRTRGEVQEVGVVDPGATDYVIHALASTPDGRTLFTGDTAGNLRTWDTTDPANPRQFGEFADLSGTVERLVVSPNGSELLAGGSDAGAYRWDISDPTHPRPLPLLPSADAVWSMAFTGDGGHVAVGNEMGQIEVWDVGGVPERVALIRPTDQPIFTVAYSPDGRLLAAGSQDSVLRLWDVSTPTRPRPIELPESRFDSWVNATTFSPDGRRLLGGSADQSLKMWTFEDSSWVPTAVMPHPAELTGAVFVDGGRTVLSTATDGTSRWWDLGTVAPTRVYGRTWGIAFDRTGGRLAMVASSEARLWDISSGSLDPELLTRTKVTELDGAGDGFSGTGALSPDGTQLAVGTRRTGEVYLIDVSNPGRQRLSGPPLDDTYDMVESVAFRGDGSALAAGGDDNYVRVWQLHRRRLPALTALLDDPTGDVYSVMWSPDGRYLAAASADSLVYLYDVADLARPTLVAKLDGLESEAYAAAFTPEGDVLATAGSDGYVVLWDITHPSSPRRLPRALTGPEARISDLAFDQNGSHLAAAAGDGTAWVWVTRDVSAAELLAVLGPVDAPFYQVEFDPATGLLAASGASGLLYLWPTDVEQVIDDICAITGEDITRREWHLYLPTTPYDPPC